jgi:hypothetical protein
MILYVHPVVGFHDGKPNHLASRSTRCPRHQFEDLRRRIGAAAPTDLVLCDSSTRPGKKSRPRRVFGQSQRYKLVNNLLNTHKKTDNMITTNVFLICIYILQYYINYDLIWYCGWKKSCTSWQLLVTTGNYETL